MTDIILSSFLSLFALFGKEEKVDEARARNLLEDYLRHHFGIRKINTYLGLYLDMRGVYEMSDDLDTETIVASICDNLHGKIRATEESMLLLRIMEFCGVKDGKIHPMFRVMAETPIHCQELSRSPKISNAPMSVHIGRVACIGLTTESGRCLSDI